MCGQCCLPFRWRKLLKSFYSEKKQQFDISKVPDIYDSAKYDAIHNSHLQLSSLGVSDGGHVLFLACVLAFCGVATLLASAHGICRHIAVCQRSKNMLQLAHPRNIKI